MNKITLYSAEWCGPCKTMKPMLYDLEEKGLFELEILDADENSKVLAEMGVRKVPTMVLNGDPSQIKVGTITQKQLEEWLDESGS